MTQDKLRSAIQNLHNNKNHFVWNGIEVFIKDKLQNEEVSITKVFQEIENKIPRYFLKNIDSIYVGQFDFLKKRNVQAMYENSSIFVTNVQDNEQDMLDDIVHEISHSVEETDGDIIYSDGSIEQEFLEKRKKLFTLVKAEGLPADLQSYLEVDYNRDFDDYLYNQIGYPLLSMLGNSFFYSPYAVTSLREYFANGFEALFCFGEYKFLKDVCPKLFEKLNRLLEVASDKEY